MTKNLTIISVRLPRLSNSINENNFLESLYWKYGYEELKSRVSEQFKRGAFASVPYNDDNRPIAKVEIPLVINKDLEFIVSVTPTKKKISYEKVNTAFGNYVNLLLDQHSDEIHRKRVLTIDEEPYIPCRDLVIKIEEYLNTLREGKEGVKRELIIVKPLLEKTPNVVSIVVGKDYSARSEYTARTFVEAEKLLKEGSNIKNSFEEFLLNEAIRELGKEPEEVTALPYQFERLGFLHQLEPRVTTPYAKIIESFIKPLKGDITTKSKIGDLVIADMISQEGVEETLKNKGLMDKDFERDYRPRIRKGEVYVRLKGVLERLDFYKKTIRSRTIEQNISLIPPDLYSI